MLGHPLSGFRVTIAHIAQRIFTVSRAITTLDVTQGIEVPSVPSDPTGNCLNP